MAHKNLNLKLKVWRQKNEQTPGAFVKYDVNDISDEMSFLEMLDVLNEKLITTTLPNKLPFYLFY